MPTLNLRLTHKANEAFRDCLGDALATTLDPFCKTRKVEVVYSLSPDDSPLSSIAAAVSNHKATGRTGKSLDRVLGKIKTFAEEAGLKLFATAPVASVVSAPEAPVDMSDVLDALDAIPDEEPKTEQEVVVATIQTTDAPFELKEPEPVKKHGLVSLVPKVRGADLLANLYRDIKKGKK
jgi:hypothetical protein